MNEPPVGARIILYDGVCALCNGATTFILQRDYKCCFLFASMQGEFAANLLQAAGRDPNNLDTLYLVEDYKTPKQRILDRSTAALRIARELKGMWSWLTALQVVPRPLRDIAYNLVARFRYRLFGKHDQCVMPKPEWKARFI